MIPEFITNPNPNLLLTDNYVVLDFETTNLDKGSALTEDNRIVLSVWGKGKYKKQWGGIYDIAALIADIEAADLLVAHHAKFELQWLKRAGLDLTKVLVYDTMIGAYVIAGNRKHKLSLGDVAERNGFGVKDPYIDLCIKDGICPSELPKSLLEQRCIKDVWQTEGVFLKQRQELLEEEMLAVQYTRCLLTPVLADIEFNGIQLDEDRVDEEYETYHREMVGISRELEIFTGGINPRSPKQKAEFLYDVLKFEELTTGRGRGKRPKRTPAGERAYAADNASTTGRLTGTKEILQLKTRTKRQREYIALQREYNRVNAALTKNLEFFYGICKEREGRFQGSFNQTVTATHRLSASGRKVHLATFEKEKSVQFQNLPRIFKRLFKARREGWKVGEIDGAQLEFRVAGFIGEDHRILSDINSGVDVHQFTADTLTTAGQSTTRQEAKADTFKPLFGGTSGTKAQQAYYKAFRDKYEGITGYQKESIYHVLDHKELRVVSGLKFYWPDTKMSRSGYINNRESVCNYPVQSLATAEIIPIAVTMLWHEMKDREMESFLVNTIHDSAIAELNPKEIELFSDIAVKSFTDYVYYYLKEVYDLEFFIPLGAGVKVGDHWSEGEEVSYESTPPYKLEEQQYV